MPTSLLTSYHESETGVLTFPYSKQIMLSYGDPSAMPLLPTTSAPFEIYCYAFQKVWNASVNFLAIVLYIDACSPRHTASLHTRS